MTSSVSNAYVPEDIWYWSPMIKHNINFHFLWVFTASRPGLPVKKNHPETPMLKHLKDLIAFRDRPLTMAEYMKVGQQFGCVLLSQIEPGLPLSKTTLLPWIQGVDWFWYSL